MKGVLDMIKKVREHPLGKLSEKKLDEISKYYGRVFTSQNMKNIKSKIQKKKDSL